MISIDIETQRDESKISLLPPPRIDSRLKDEAKIKAAQERGREEQINKMALSPYTGTVASVAIVDDATEECRVLGRDGDEASIINWAINSLKGHQSCGWNSQGFDLPFLYTRAMLLNISVPQPLSRFTKRYSTDPHIDIMQVLAGWDKQNYMKLDYAAQHILGDAKVEFDVLTIPELLKTAEGQKKLAIYNTKDAALVLALYNKTKMWFF